MNGAGRATPMTSTAPASPATRPSASRPAAPPTRPPGPTLAADPAGGHMGRVGGPQIDLGVCRRRVTGNDLFMFHALVSENDQTIEDLSELRPSDAAALARYARQTRPPFVTEGWLDRMNARLSGWLAGCARAAVHLVAGGDDEPAPPRLPARPRQGPARGAPPRPETPRAPKRAA